MKGIVLQTDRLTKRYARRLVVDQLSLTVEQGDIFGFLGQNGAGKSTTIRMIVGLVRPTSGRVSVLGCDIGRRHIKALRDVGAIIEAPAFYENFSGRQNLRMLASMSGGADRKQVDGVLDIVGLRARAEDPVRVYSHGMRQRLGIAQALLPQPKFIILDEPTDGLDPQGLSETRTLIKHLRSELGLTIMLSSHLLHEVEQICNRVAIIDAGRLLFEGAVDDLVAGQGYLKLRVDRLNEALSLLEQLPGLSVSRNGDEALHLKIGEGDVARVNSLLVQRGFRVMELSPQRESLEDVFLRLTGAGKDNDS